MKVLRAAGRALCLGLLTLAPAFAAPDEPPAVVLAHANDALQAGEADKALALLASLPGSGQSNAQAQNIACRVEFTLGQWDAAAADCQQAVRLDPQNSWYHMWLGRTFGEKANKASFLAAFSLGKRVLAEFQTAAQLDPRNAEALSDLGEFYLEAPAIVGGGLDKAESVASELDRFSPARADELRARIAEVRHDYAGAEDFFQKAVAASPHPALQWATLARFYQMHQRWDDMDAALRKCMEAAERDPHAVVGLYDGAGVLIRANRSPELAAKMLQDYLAGRYKSDEAPAFVAYARLARLQQQMGEPDAAQSSLAAAYELAHEYDPAQDLRR